MSYSDDEPWDGLADLPHDISQPAERSVRRRSSKACDQCRKSKCKCERPNLSEPCKNCILIGTTCTFLGPSRKRGPPKGYIDAIEARLHQTEALIGIMLATSDNRARSLLIDLSQDPLAREIINRVDTSQYGVKGRLKGEEGSKTSSTVVAKLESVPDLRTTHPSTEWQDRVTKILNTLPPQPAQDYNSPKSDGSEGNTSQTSRRQRRRVGTQDYSIPNLEASKSPSDESRSGTTSWYQTPSPAPWGDFTFGKVPVSGTTDRASSSVDSEALDSDSEEELLSAVGQLSLNEEEQIRYHGKASGIYLLRKKEGLGQRNEGGIWRFPKARVWPPLPSTLRSTNNNDLAIDLPPIEKQEHMLNLYFTYVHPYLPVLHKESFLQAFRDGARRHSEAPAERISETSPTYRRDIPLLLLLVMFACASRYDSISNPFPSDPSVMWSAGDDYLERAKIVLNSTYASSRPATVQALLLMGYREAGIGDMSLAWTYVGMGIRMAQDLGMHRAADGWKRSGHGRLFSEWQLAERKRIWFGCVVLDKFVSCFIGRPIAVFDSDFDTLLPSIDDLEENEEWSVEMTNGEQSPPTPGRMLSCFNAIAELFVIFGKVMQGLYAIHPAKVRQTEALVLERTLDRWYYDLPDHLRCEVVSIGSPSSSSSKQKRHLPNVLALHMCYWAIVLILHRPFMTHILHRKDKPSEKEDSDTRSRVSRSYELCRTAATHVASLVSIYQENYLFHRCPPLVIYSLFQCTILLDADVAINPSDPQARLSFSKCISGLNGLSVVWPSAERAQSLFTGSKTGGGGDDGSGSMVELTRSSTTTKREGTKRAAEEELRDSFDRPVSVATAHNNAATPTTTTGRTAAPPPNSNRSGPPPPLPLFAPKPHTSIGIGELQRRYSQPGLSRPATTVELFAAGGGGGGGQATYNVLSDPAITSPPSPLLPELANSVYMADMNAFGNQLSTAVIPHLYSSGFLDDVEVVPGMTHHGMSSHQQQQPLQEYQILRSGTTYSPQLVSSNQHEQYELPEPFPSHLQHHPHHQQQQQHQHHPHPLHHQQRHLPRMPGPPPPPIRNPIGHHQQQHSDSYVPHRFNVYM